MTSRHTMHPLLNSRTFFTWFTKTRFKISIYGYLWLLCLWIYLFCSLFSFSEYVLLCSHYLLIVFQYWWFILPLIFDDLCSLEMLYFYEDFQVIVVHSLKETPLKLFKTFSSQQLSFWCDKGREIYDLRKWNAP